MVSENWRPNWYNEQSYQRFETCSDEELAWEFLRRNRQYAEDWRPDPRADLWVWLDHMTGPEPVVVGFDEYEQLCRDYQVFELYPPSTNTELVKFLPFRPQWQNYGGTSGEPRVSLESVSEIVIKFELGANLDRQLEWAKVILKLAQRDLGLRPENTRSKRQDRQHYPKCLRLLDGSYAGATGYELGKVLFSNVENPRQRAVELLKTAQAYSEWKYKQLIDRPLKVERG